MTLETVGQSVVAEWCRKLPQTVATWINCRTDYPEPDVTIKTRRNTVRGWLPSRRTEWEAYAKERANAPGALLAAQRGDRQKDQK